MKRPVRLRVVNAAFLIIILRYLSYFSIKIYVVGTHFKQLGKALLISTHNICFIENWGKLSP